MFGSWQSVLSNFPYSSDFQVVDSSPPPYLALPFFSIYHRLKDLSIEILAKSFSPFSSYRRHRQTKMNMTFCYQFHGLLIDYGLSIIIEFWVTMQFGSIFINTRYNQTKFGQFRIISCCECVPKGYQVLIESSVSQISLQVEKPNFAYRVRWVHNIIDPFGIQFL